MDVRNSGDYLNTELLYSFSSYFYYIVRSVAQLWNVHTGELLAWDKSEIIGLNFKSILDSVMCSPRGMKFVSGLLIMCTKIAVSSSFRPMNVWTMWKA